LAVTKTIAGDSPDVGTLSNTPFGSGAFVGGIRGAYRKLAMEYSDKSLNCAICS